MRYTLLLVLILALCSCDDQRLFEENKSLDTEFWYVDSLMTFGFGVSDISTSYNLYANFSHSSEYNFHNLYYKYLLTDSTEKELVSELVNIHFYDPKSGKPLGSGLGDVFDHRHLIVEDYKFEKPGYYKLSFQQYMRTDSLPDIVSVGARIERAVDQ